MDVLLQLSIDELCLLKAILDEIVPAVNEEGDAVASDVGRTLFLKVEALFDSLPKKGAVQ